MKLGVIGIGKMGTALLRGILQAGTVSQANTFIFNHSPSAYISLLGDFPNITICESSQDVAMQADVIILAVKPQGILQLLSDMSQGIAPHATPPLLISIAVGIPLMSLEKYAASNAHIIRSMPNTPALIGQGSVALAQGSHANAADLQMAIDLFSSIGSVMTINESHMDAVSAISGSGPAYMFSILNAMADAGVALGLPRPIALQLATETMLGSASMVLKNDRHIMELRDDVTSPGGTTIAALNTFDQLGLNHTIIAGIKSAYNRSKEIAQQ